MALVSCVAVICLGVLPVVGCSQSWAVASGNQKQASSSLPPMVPKLLAYVSVGLESRLASQALPIFVRAKMMLHSAKAQVLANALMLQALALPSAG
jgi:hypothetical protein